MLCFFPDMGPSHRFNFAVCLPGHPQKAVNLRSDMELDERVAVSTSSSFMATLLLDLVFQLFQHLLAIRFPPL